MMNTEHRTQNAERRTQNPASLNASPWQTSAPCLQFAGAGERRTTRHAFSLTEVLLAVGTLAIGMLFIAAVFPVSINFTTVATERTIAAAAADEAFAKIKLYGIYDPNVVYNAQTPYENAAPVWIPDSEFAYPSTPSANPYEKQYWWSAICRKTSPDPLDREVQVTVFVSRKPGVAATYYMRDPYAMPNLITNASRPMPVVVSVGLVVGGAADERRITDSMPADTINEIAFINDGYTIVEDRYGYIYRVLERYKDNTSTPSFDESQIIRLDRAWQGGGAVWVIPSPPAGGRYPCIAVYQKVMRF